MRLLNIKAKDSAFLRYNKGISTKLFLPFAKNYHFSNHPYVYNYAETQP